MSHPRIFISYCIDDKRFVHETCNMLEPYFQRENMYLFEEHPNLTKGYPEAIAAKIKESDVVLYFAGARFSHEQATELDRAVTEVEKAVCIIGVNGQRDVSDFPQFVQRRAGTRHILFDDYTQRVPPATSRCAQDILGALRNWWRAHPDYHTTWKEWSEANLLHGLPRVPQLFDYEKNIIEFYAAKRLAERTHDEVLVSPAEISSSRQKSLKSHWPEATINEYLQRGVPATWPQVYRYPTICQNRLHEEQAGKFRTQDGEREALVRAAALLDLDFADQPFTFLEAGPRPYLSFPRRNSHELKVAIVIGGGIAPGINAVIDAIVQRHDVYLRSATDAGEQYGLSVKGIKNGFLAVPGHDDLSLQSLAERELSSGETVEYATRGGSMLGTSRDERLLDAAERNSRLHEIAEALRPFDILYVIGGDGSMKAAHALWHVANRRRRKERPLSVITIPKTMDNDILWVWQSFGFLSAVDESRQIVETLHTEVRSNPRLGIVQLFGSDSGFVVSHAVLAATAGHAILALIPEIKFSALGVARYLKRRLWNNAAPNRQTMPGAPIDPNLAHGLVVMAENAVPEDALECLGLANPPDDDALRSFANVYAEIAREIPLTDSDQREMCDFVERQREGRRLEGQTSDTIRKLSLRIMAEALPRMIRHPGLKPLNGPFPYNEPDWERLRVVCSEPRHLVRSLEPSTSDIITGQRLGLLAVDAAMAGYTDCMISQWLTEFTLVPLDLVVLGRKRVPEGGMFWKSVISKTEQDGELVSPFHREAGNQTAGPEA